MISFVFPGQGSQSIGMLKDIAAVYPEVESVFEEASLALGYNLWKLCSEGPAEGLNKTVHTQPALLAASYAIWKIIQKHRKVVPAFLAGHSLGEYTALVCANAIGFKDAIRLVAARGEYMQEAVPLGEGALAAIVGLDDDRVKLLCDQAALSDVLAPANYNCPGQVVIAGHTRAVERAIASAEAMGARLAKLLPVSVPSHCALMKPAATKLAHQLDKIEIKIPESTVINNVDVKPYLTVEQIRDGLVRQLFMPVRWVEIIQSFVRQGVTQIIECGPGKVLMGLNKRISSEVSLAHTADLTALQRIIGE